MAVGESLWMAHLRREQLLDVLQGNGFDAITGPFRESKVLREIPGQITAIWRAEAPSDRTPLPQVLIADEVTLQDLFAWVATYLRGIGPITAQTRALTSQQFNAARSLEQTGRWWRFAGGLVGLVLGELVMHTRRITPFEELSVSACRATLSFVFARAIAIGVSPEAIKEITATWHRARRLMGQPAAMLQSDMVGDVAQVFFSAIGRNTGFQTSFSRANDWFAALLEGMEEHDLIVHVASDFGSNGLVDGLSGIRDRTAEERVSIYDKLTPALLDHPTMAENDKAFAVALAAFVCRPGFYQQATLLSPYVTKLPEAVLWLGAMQAKSPMVEVLSSGDGLGWRLMRDLSQPTDVFSSPLCDVSALELEVLQRGRSAQKMIKSLTRMSLDVELYPLVSGSIRRQKKGMEEQPELPIESPAENFDDTNDREEILQSAETLLQNCLRLIRDARVNARRPSPNYRRRRK